MSAQHLKTLQVMQPLLSLNIHCQKTDPVMELIRRSWFWACVFPPWSVNKSSPKKAIHSKKRHQRSKKNKNNNKKKGHQSICLLESISHKSSEQQAFRFPIALHQDEHWTEWVSWGTTKWTSNWNSWLMPIWGWSKAAWTSLPNFLRCNRFHTFGTLPEYPFSPTPFSLNT